MLWSRAVSSIHGEVASVPVLPTVRPLTASVRSCMPFWKLASPSLRRAPDSVLLPANMGAPRAATQASLPFCAQSS